MLKLFEFLKRRSMLKANITTYFDSMTKFSSLVADKVINPGSWTDR